MSADTTPTQRVTAANTIEYAYRSLGASDVPLAVLQHFRANLVNWDPPDTTREMPAADDQRLCACDLTGRLDCLGERASRHDLV